MLESYFVDECELVETTRNDFGDEVQNAVETLSCRWRDITLLRRGSHQDNSDADSLVHFPPSAPVVRGSILKHNGEYYQVDDITFAKKLGSTKIEFIKCGVNVTNLGIS